MQELWLQRLPWDVLSLAAAKHGVDPMLVAAITQTESSGNRYALKYEKDWSYLKTPEIFAKELGITLETEIKMQMFSFSYMQIMGSVARELGHIGPMPFLFEPALAFDLGCKKLAQCLKKYPKPDYAIAAYNAGAPRFLENGELVNEAYVQRVRSYWGPEPIARHETN